MTTNLIYPDNIITMPPLKNRKHEKLAQALLKTDNDVEAYKISTGNYHATNEVANSSVSRILTNVNVKERVRELLESRANTSLNGLTAKLDQHVGSNKEEISLKASELGFRLHGALDRENESAPPPADIEIQILNVSSPNDLHNTNT